MSSRASRREPGKTDTTCDLLYGITAWHLRKLCDSQLNGALGLKPAELAALTPDQFWFLWLPPDAYYVRDGVRVQKTSALQASALVDSDGTIKARAADGSAIKLKMSTDGLSLAGRLNAARRQREADARISQRSKKRK